jgi:hypothetical protein
MAHGVRRRGQEFLRVFIETRVLGKKSRPLDGWAVPTPPESGDEGERLTLRSLIERVVRAEVQAFTSRERAQRLVRVLSEASIAEGAVRGRVDPGGRPAGETVNPERAVGAALQGFVDGLYLVVIDGAEQRDLESQVFVNADSKVVFLRLTFLAGA